MREAARLFSSVEVAFDGLGMRTVTTGPVAPRIPLLMPVSSLILASILGFFGSEMIIVALILNHHFTLYRFSKCVVGLVVVVFIVLASQKQFITELTALTYYTLHICVWVMRTSRTQ